MKAVVNIQKGIVPWICGISANQVAVRTNAATLQKWDNGEKPTLTQVSKMSQELNVPFGYFFLSTPCENQENSPVFRTVGSKEKENMSQNLKDTVNNMELIQEWLKDEMSEEDLGTSPITGILNEQDNVLSASQKLRTLLHIETDWYRKTDKNKVYLFLREKAGEAQVFVFENGIVGNNTKRSLSLDEFRAFALYDDIAPVIFINSLDSIQAKAFSLLHEIAHIALGQADLMEGGYSHEESFCNSVATEIMVPEKQFTEFWTKKRGLLTDKLTQAASFFKCSISVATLRAYKLGFISKATCDKQFNIISQNIKKRSGSGGNFYNSMSSRMDHNFLSLLFTSVHEGKTRYTDAYRMTGCWGKTFERMMAEVVR